MKKRVLCIEDHPDTCELISVILEDYEVVSAHFLEVALKKATVEKFDLYVVDFHLPDGLGLEFIIYVKSLNDETPILIVTGSPINESKAESLGAVGIIKKASTSFVEDLRHRVNQLLGEDRA